MGFRKRKRDISLDNREGIEEFQAMKLEDRDLEEEMISSAGGMSDEAEFRGGEVGAVSATLLDIEDEKDGENAGERRARFRNMLLRLEEYTRVLHSHRRLEKGSLEEEVEVQRNLEASLDDLIIMSDFVHFNQPDDSLVEKVQKMKVKRRVDKLNIVSWDLGMLSYLYMGTRAKAVADLVQKEEYDIVFLQESNPIVSKYLFTRLWAQYALFSGRKSSHKFSDEVLTLVRRDTFRIVKAKIIFFSNTGEKRSLLKVEVETGSGSKLCLFNTHLESMLGNSIFRVKQLQKCFDTLLALHPEYEAILGGSLNVREWEMFKKIHKHPKIVDLWEALGDSSNEFTWDLQITKLIQMPNEGTTDVKRSSKQPRKRFDRIYYRLTKKNLLNPVSFELIGKEVVAGGCYHASDHFGIHVVLDISQEPVKHLQRSSSGASPASSCSGLTLLTKGLKKDSLKGEDEEAEVKVKDCWEDDSE